MKTNSRNFIDAVSIARRCILLSRRNPDTLLTSVLLPFLMMFLFVSLFGSLIQIGEVSYVNYIVPGVLLQCIGQCSSATAILMNRDISNGMAGRYCALPIRRSSFLNGHILEAAARNLLTSAVIFAAAALLGFRPSAGPAGWLAVLLLLAAAVFTFSWLAVLVGIAARSPEGAGALSSLAILLPYLSSGFVPTEALPSFLRLFAEYQPLTPIMDTMRNAFLGGPIEPAPLLASLCWCSGLSAACSLSSVFLFQKRISG